MRQLLRSRTLPSVLVAFVLAAGLALGAPGHAVANDYNEHKAGHPLRIAGYALHPVGVILDRLIFRPAWWLGGFEPIRTLVGREEPSEE